MSKRINLPGDSRPATFAEGMVEKAKSKSVLVDDGTVMCSGLVVHAPAAEDELQTTCKTSLKHISVNFNLQLLNKIAMIEIFFKFK